MSPVSAPFLRPATAADEIFLFRLYADTRREELAATGWSERERMVFLRAQYAARARSYRADFPGAAHLVALAGRTPIGALIVHRTAGEIRLVDLAIVPARRGAGLGTQLLRQLMDEAHAAHKPLRLQVRQDNPAFRLYLRLGFAPVGNNGLHVRMEWLPPGAGP